MAKWLTVKQTAEYLQLSTTTVYSMVRNNLLPGTRLGNQWRFEASQIDDWLRQNSPETPVKKWSNNKNDKSETS
jgi:excisionase family DNA binding protein